MSSVTPNGLRDVLIQLLQGSRDSNTGTVNGNDADKDAQVN